ncbi:divergent polysaccharide deacetylase family protein, partial [Pectobacterium versatile]
QVKQPPEPVKNDVFFKLVSSSIRESAPVMFIKHRWQTWIEPAETETHKQP